MLPVAIGIEADEARQQFGAVSAAISGSFAKDGAKLYLDALDKINRQVKRAGEKKAAAADPQRATAPSTADQILGAFKKLGVAIPSPKKRGKSNG